jgi:hypothetical protein
MWGAPGYVSVMKPVPTWFIAVCWVMAVGFCICVGLQVNDPDPVRWMAIYGGAAITLAALPARKVFAAGTLVIGVISAIWGAYLGHEVKDVLVFSDLWMKMSEKGGAVEVGREAGGLAIVAITLLGASAFRVTRA